MRYLHLFVFASSIVFVSTLDSTRCSAEIYGPGQTVPGLSAELFTWSQVDQNSTYAFWDSFGDFPGGSVPGGIAPGISPAANDSFADGGAESLLTFDSFATIISSGNAYGFNFAPGQPGFQPDFITDAHATVRSGTSGGDHTRIVAQWQTQGSELDYDSILLSLSPGIAGTIAPSLSIETGRQSLGGFGGELVNRLAVWDLDSSQAEYRVDFNAEANHMSFDQFRVDTFTQLTSFVTPTAIPEPSGVALLGVVLGAVMVRRQRRRGSAPASHS